MKFLISALILLTSFFFMGFAKQTTLYQVISAHPHDVKEYQAFVKTVHKSGRLQVVELKPGAPASVMKYLRPLTGREKSYHYRATGFVVNNDSEIQKMVDQVSIDNIKKDVVQLSSYTTRAVGTKDNQAATLRVQKTLDGFGLKTSQICYRAEACSIIADKPGRARTDEVILVIAHIDSVGQKFAGADDNASGTAALIEMARVLSQVDNEKTYRFFVTNGEESGLLGAHHYVGELKKNNKLKNIVLALNMDMVGYNSNGMVELETDSKFEAQAKWFAELAAAYTSLKSKITLGAWGSDHVPFIKAGVPTVLTIEYWDTKTPCYHAACDKPDTLNYVYAGEITKLNVAAVLTRDQE